MLNKGWMPFPISSHNSTGYDICYIQPFHNHFPGLLPGSYLGQQMQKKTVTE